VKDAAGTPVAVRPPATGVALRGEERAPAPAWFAALIASPVVADEVPVIVDGKRIGNVEIVGEPKDEIAEVWENTVALGTAGFFLNAAVIGLLYVLFGRVLDPLTGLARGLSDLELQNYTVRLPRPPARELAAITNRFNAVALALETTRAENLRLNRRLITAQDDERRRTALDLHDEVGPSLFGLKATASSIASAAKALPEQTGRIMTERAREMLTIIEHLQVLNRSLLNRLRPMALGHVPLRDILSELVHERERQNPGISFTFTAENLMRSYGDSIDLTLYRCIQESLTNVIRHAQAKHVDIHLGAGDANLILAVADDGSGIDPGAPMGFGITGMRERVEGLGGHYAVESSSGEGTRIRITIPVNAGSGSAGGAA
jgi:two-component system sensor histidine kinase UhpB